MTTSVEPDAGHCQITPKEGTSLIDKYKVDCNQWEPWGQRSFCTNKDTDELVYELRTINTNSSDLIYKHKKSSFPLLWLPSGDKESAYNLDLVVYVSDDCGQIGRFALNATVYSADTSNANMEWTNSLVEDILNLNDTAEAMGALSIVAQSVGSTPGEKTILASLSKAADVALDVALLTLDSEEEGSFTLVTEFIEATVEKRNSSSLKNKQLTSKFGGFTLPGCEQENGTRVRFVKVIIRHID
ncbi:polycystin family receptor for egg jelly-like [Ptychodera flava]|uniref:polycystin family receptor for egg jelly-like n=1 Tax=Ptychodera flava TaxID=63121 RepID=UPI003969EDA9